MFGFLRFIGVINASIWFGAGVFFTFAAGPAMFSNDMRELLGSAFPAYSGAIAQIVVKRYYVLHFICAGVAIGHLVLETLYSGRPFDRISGILLAVLLGLSIAGGMFQPRLKVWHATKYSSKVTEAVRQEAALEFRRWHGVAQVVNLAMLAGVMAYLWRTVPSRAQGSAPAPRSLVTW